MSQVIGELCLDKVDFVRLEDGVYPHLICPVCKRDWTPNLSLGSTFPATFDFNKKISFTVPNHNNAETSQPCTLSGQKIELFVAVHRDTNGVQICIQRSDAEGASGIPANWWQSHT
jgi:hypothetical protein